MSTESHPPAAAATPKPSDATPKNEREKRGHLRLHKIYLKDLSYESPNTPMIFSKASEPAYQVNLDTHHTHAGDGDYSVELMVTVSVTAEQMSVFLIEVKMVGLFSIVGFSGEFLQYLLGCDCPGMLYPYVREIISDMSTRGGFYPVLLNPVDFDNLYQKKQKQQQPKPPSQQQP